MAFRPVEPSRSPVLVQSIYVECRAHRLKLTVDDHDLARGLLFADLVQNAVDGFTKDDTGGADLLGRPDVEVRNRVRFDVEEDVPSETGWVSTGFKVLDRGLDGDDVVTVGRALDVGDAGSHHTLANH